ncbi:MAG: hypothetical protein FJ011_08680 [Chloroflexi bacterium]|nr:hypothetical protein [Chloroflexota bacterium]
MTGIRPNFDPTHLYFVTTSAVGYVHLFQRDVIKRILVDSLHYMRVNHWISLFCFVIMPNHIHFIARFQEAWPVKAVVREFKKHTSKQIIRQYQAEENRAVLQFLEAALALSAGRAVLSSSQGYQPSYMRRDGAMSIFTYHLIEALTGHARPAAGATEVLVSDVMSHVWRRVPASARQDWGEDQQPDYQISGNFPVALLVGGQGLGKGIAPPNPVQPLASASPAVSQIMYGAGVQVASDQTVHGDLIVGGDKIGVRDL